MKRKQYAAAWAVLIMASAAPGVLVAQAPRKPFQSQSSSTITYGVKDNEETVEINNISYQLSGDSVPGLAPAERLVLRQTDSRNSLIIQQICLH